MQNARRVVMGSLLVLGVFSAGCGPTYPETCFCGGEVIKRFELMQEAGNVSESFKGAAVREQEGVACVCVPATHLPELTQTRLDAIKQAIAVYETKESPLPKTLEILVTSGLLKADGLQDGWFNPFQYEQDGPDKFRICSASTDGVMGTEDDLCVSSNVP